MSAPQPETTDILGYFNRNSFPVVISINSLNVNVTVGSKKYLVNSNGDKINDPILRRAAKQLYGLTIELSPTPLKIIALPRPGVVIQSAGFGGVHNTTPEKATEAAAAPKRVVSKSDATPAPVKPAVAGSATKDPSALVSRENTKAGNPVRGMSAEEARKRGLILPTTSSNEGVEDNNLELTGEKIPEIKIAQDIRGKRRPKPVAEAETKAETRPEDEALEGIDTVDVARLTADLKSKVEAESSPKPAEPVETPAVEEPPQSVAVTDADPAVSELERQIASASAAVQVPEVAQVPQPEAPPAVAEAAPSASAKDDNPFSIDGKSFPSRSYLERYVKRHYKPEEVDGIMAKYPASRRAAKVHT
jgi:hypothetical protein